jgi:DNA-directed RNA polymerase specialized sigma24 family protein
VLAGAGFELCTTSPRPIIDHGWARMEALDDLAQIRASKEVVRKQGAGTSLSRDQTRGLYTTPQPSLTESSRRPAAMTQSTGYCAGPRAPRAGFCESGPVILCVKTHLPWPQGPRWRGVGANRGEIRLFSRFGPLRQFLPRVLSPMSSECPGSVTHWLSLLRAGDPQAPEALWDRYFARVLHLAHQQLLGLRDRSRDAEDVALSTLNALCQAAQQGRLANVQDRHDLWRLLVTCTLNRARNLRSHENALKRRAELVAETRPRPEAGLANAQSTEPTPDEAAQLADELRHMMQRLDVEDPTHRLREVALLKLEGYTVEEIARRQQCARKTVSLRLSVIRGLWRKELLT